MVAHEHVGVHLAAARGSGLGQAFQIKAPIDIAEETRRAAKGATGPQHRVRRAVLSSAAVPALALLSSDCGTAATQPQSSHPGLSLTRAVLGPTQAEWLSGAGHYAYCTVHPWDGSDLAADLRPAAGG